MIGLGTRLAWSVAILLLGTALLGGAALTGLLGLSRHFDAAQDQYDELRSVFEIGHDVAMMRLMLDAEHPDQAGIRDQVVKTTGEIRNLQLEIARTHRDHDEFALRVKALDRQMSSLISQIDSNDHVSLRSNALNATLGSIAWLAGESKKSIIENRHQAAARADRATGMIAVIFAVTMMIGIGIAFMLHRAVMNPVRSLRQAVHELTHAKFGRTVAETGDREWRELISRFNAMSREIHRLHQSMRMQVDAKSRQLVRSEQLASIGYLAAGIAHEINNPLGIIAGHAELTLRRIESAADHGAPDVLRDQTRQAMSIICDEAFRCRDITGDLLQMARPFSASTESVGMMDVVRRAVGLVQSLPVAAGKSIMVSSEREDSQLAVQGHRSQLLQVMINVLTNALEACEPDVGRVLVSVDRTPDAVVVDIIDNGCGMAEQTLQHAFDPFFTDKPQRGLAGTGLGLSLCNAIVERHRGVLNLASDGPGCGSNARIQWPVAATERSEADAQFDCV